MWKDIKNFLKTRFPILVACKKCLRVYLNPELLHQRICGDVSFAEAMERRYPQSAGLIGFCRKAWRHALRLLLAWRCGEEIPTEHSSPMEILERYIHKEHPACSPEAPPKLLLYINSLSRGDAERQWCCLACELAARGYNTTMLVSSLQGEAGHYIPMLSGCGVQLQSLESLRFPPYCRHQHASLFPNPVPALTYAIRMHKPTHVLCQVDDTNIPGGISAILSEVGIQKILLSFHSDAQSHCRIQEPWAEYYKILLQSPLTVLSGNSGTVNSDCAVQLGITTERIHHIPDVIVPEHWRCFHELDARGLGDRTLTALALPLNP